MQQKKIQVRSVCVWVGGIKKNSVGGDRVWYDKKKLFCSVVVFVSPIFLRYVKNPKTFFCFSNRIIY